MKKQKHIRWVSKLNCKTEFFVPYSRHQNCLDKSLKIFRFLFLNWVHPIYFKALRLIKKEDEKHTEKLIKKSMNSRLRVVKTMIIRLWVKETPGPCCEKETVEIRNSLINLRMVREKSHSQSEKKIYHPRKKWRETNSVSSYEHFPM